MKRQVIISSLMVLMGSFAAQAQNWFPVSSGTTKKLNTIDFPSATVGYIGGNDSLLLKTTDGGRNWNPLTFSGITFTMSAKDIQNLDFVDENTGYLTLGPFSGTYKTVDGGLNWLEQNTTTNLCASGGLYFFDENNGFVGGAGCFQGESIGHLSNGTWSESTVNFPIGTFENYVTDIDFLNSTNGLAASRSGYVLRTSDGGLNWDTIPTPSQSGVMNPLTSILFVDDTLAYAGYEAVSIGFGLYISTDGGLSWQEDMNSATFFYPDFFCLHQSENGEIYSGGSSTSTSGGLIFQYPGPFNSWWYSSVAQSIHGISSYNDSIVFAVGDSGYVVVNHDFATLKFNELQKNSPDVTLFPNPVKSILNLELKNYNPSLQSEIRIYSVLGELVRTEKISSSIDVSALKNGVYFVEARLENRVIRKKFIKE